MGHIVCPLSLGGGGGGVENVGVGCGQRLATCFDYGGDVFARSNESSGFPIMRVIE